MNFFDQMFKTPNFTPGDPVKTQEAQLERRRQAARRLIEQSMQRTPDTMVGGGGGGGRWQPRPSILVPGNTLGTAIAQGAAGYTAGRENDAIDKAETAAARQREQQQRDWLARQPGASDAAAVGMPHTPGGEPPTVAIRNQLDVLMGDENKAAMESADNESAMMGAFSNQPGQPVGDDGVFAHPALTATGPTDLPPQGGTEPAQPPQGMSDRDQLRWLLEGAMIEAPGANLLLNQAGRELMLGDSGTSGDTAQIKNYRFAQSLPESERASFLGSTAANDPAAIAEWKAFQKMGPEEKRQYLSMKRSNQVINMGGSTAVVDATGMPVAQYAKSLPPEAQPYVKGQQAEAQARAAQGVSQQAAASKKVAQAGDTLQTLNQVAEIFRSGAVTGSGVGTLANTVRRAAGVSTAATKNDAQLKMLSGKLLMNVPRFEGPQSDKDVATYREMAGSLGDSTIPLADRKATLQRMRDMAGRAAGSNSPAAPLSDADLLKKYGVK